jgi:hypothetical protein
LAFEATERDKKKLLEHAKRIELPLENPFDSTISLAMLAI